MDTHGTCQLGDTGNRKFYFLAGCHDQITELIYNHHDVWHILMSICQLQLVVDILLVVFFDVTGSCLFEQVVTAIHQYTQTVQGSNHLGYIGYDRFFLIRNRSHKLIGNTGVDAKLHFLRVDENQFEFVWMFLV